MKRFFQRKEIILILKILIFLLLTCTVYEQVFKKQSLSQAVYLFRQGISPFALMLFLFVVVLMPVNWLLEAKKWQLLINKLEVISFSTSIKAILSGVTLGVITPYRLGDYAGRLLVLHKTEPIKAIAVTIVGNFAQIIITVVAGMVSICLYCFLYVHLQQFSLILLGVSSLLLAYLLIDLYFRINLTGNFFKRFSFYKKISYYLEVLTAYNRKELLTVLLLSALRYAIFTAQYLALLNMFGIHLVLFTGVMFISIIFILQAIIPSVTIVELGVRGNLAVYFFSTVSNNTLGILSASFTLWLINLVIPALAGLWFIFKNNTLKNNG